MCYNIENSETEKENEMKIAKNTCFGGFSLSQKAVDLINDRLPERKEPINNVDLDFYWEWRSHPIVIAVIEELGEEANISSSNVKIVEIPDDVIWEIIDYDGIETIREKGRSW